MSENKVDMAVVIEAGQPMYNEIDKISKKLN